MRFTSRLYVIGKQVNILKTYSFFHQSIIHIAFHRSRRQYAAYSKTENMQPNESVILLQTVKKDIFVAIETQVA